MFLAAMRHRHISFVNVTTLQLLTHLYDTYAMIKDPDLDVNKARMYAPYDINLPIETLFDQIEEGLEYAAAGRSLFTNEQVMSIAYMTVLKNGMFPDETKE